MARIRKSAAGHRVTRLPGGAELDGAELGAPAQILFEFPHGLGDLLQFSIVLGHLVDAQPAASVDVVCADGFRKSITPFERERFGFGDKRFKDRKYPQRIRVDFGDCGEDLAGFPSSKAYRAVRELLRLDPKPELFTYTLTRSEEARRRATKYLAKIAGNAAAACGRFPIVILHYQGTSSRMNKDLTHEAARRIVELATSRNRNVALLDFDQESPLADNIRCHRPPRGHPVWGEAGSPDPETLACLIDQAEAFVGIDSGPLHVAATSSTPALGVWTHHHPIRFFDFSSNVIHLVPVGHRRLAPGPRSVETFRTRYRHVVYGDQVGAIVEELGKLLAGELPGDRPVSEALPGLRATGYGEDYYTEHVLAGLDYLGHGDWQRQYGAWLSEVLGWKDHRVLDVGCACGSVMRGLGEAGVIVQGFDVSEFMIRRGRQRWPDMAELLHVCDVVNLHLWPADSWDGLHCAQVAEHWRPELVPFIIQELARVTRAGGLWLCVLDTTELFERNGRRMENEDPTHVCVRPLAWWHDQLETAGWDLVTAEYLDALKMHPRGFLGKYDWDLFIARKRRA